MCIRDMSRASSSTLNTVQKVQIPYSPLPEEKDKDKHGSVYPSIISIKGSNEIVHRVFLHKAVMNNYRSWEKGSVNHAVVN